MRFWREKSLRRWNPFKTRIPPLSFYYGTVNDKLKFIQNRSKNRFWGKRTTIDHRQGNSTFIYHWFIYIVSDISLQVKQTVNPVHLLYNNNQLLRHIVWAPCDFTLSFSHGFLDRTLLITIFSQNLCEIMWQFWEVIMFFFFIFTQLF